MQHCYYQQPFQPFTSVEAILQKYDPIVNPRAIAPAAPIQAPPSTNPFQRPNNDTQQVDVSFAPNMEGGPHAQ